MLKKKTTIFQLTFFLFFNVVDTYGQPVIQSFSPVSGYPGSLVTISGMNFNAVPANNIVRFGGTKAQVIAAGTNFLTVKVPAGAISKPITVTSNNLTAYSSYSFQLTFPGGGMLFSNNFFAPPVNYNSMPPESLRLTDFDDDGKPDLVWVQPGSGTINIRRNQSFPGTISMAPPVSFMIPGSIHIEPGDIDGDGRTDLCLLRESGLVDSFTILKNTSSPGVISFFIAGSFATGHNQNACSMGDLDGDGRPELTIVSTLDTSVYVYKNTTSGGGISFSGGIRFISRKDPMETAICDLNGDGKPELIAVNANSVRNSCVSIFGNICTPGNIALAARTDYFADNGIFRVLADDMNSDMKPDVITGGGGLYRNLTLHNTGTGSNFSFTEKIIDIGFVISGLHLGDLNGDGKPDVAGGSFLDSSVVVLRNMSTKAGILIPLKSNAYPTGRGSKDLASADIDGDGRPDLVSCNKLSYSISVLRSLAPACHLTINQFPYQEDFEISDGNWFGGGNESDWEWGNPAKPLLNTAGMGSKCWMTGTTSADNYLSDQSSWLRSPCFDFSTLLNPEISFKLFWDTERNNDGANFQYSLDSGITWLTVGSANSNIVCTEFNWYNSSFIPSLNGQDGWSGTKQAVPAGCTGGGGSGGWVFVKHNLGFLARQPKVIFRFFSGTNGSCNALNGIAVDDIKIGESVKSKVFLGGDTSFCPGNTLLLNPGSFISYLWQDNSRMPTYNVTREGTYYVKVSDSIGCVSYDTINVTFDCKDIYFSNGFTPNEDGLNDLFGPSGDIASISSFIFTVYDRLGQVMYTTTNPYEKWDGKCRGKELNSQTLVWLAVYTYRGKKYTRKGTITLVR